MNICIHCGNTEEEHHAFEPIKVPDGCQCNPRDWGNPRSIPKVCGEWVDDGGAYCKNCEHEKECHQSKPQNREAKV